jgi:hypothetical protein
MSEAAILGQGNFGTATDICGTDNPEIHGAHLLCDLRRHSLRPEGDSGLQIASAASRPVWLRLRIELQEIVIEFAF